MLNILPSSGGKTSRNKKQEYQYFYLRKQQQAPDKGLLFHCQV